MTTHIKDCYYCVDIQGCEDEQEDSQTGQAVFILVGRDFWEAKKKCNDADWTFDGLPPGFHMASESAVHYNGPINDGATALQAAGCEFSPALDKWIN